MDTIMQKHSMPVCFNTDQYKIIESIARRHGMLTPSQAIEKILDDACN